MPYSCNSVAEVHPSAQLSPQSIPVPLLYYLADESHLIFNILGSSRTYSPDLTVGRRESKSCGRCDSEEQRVSNQLRRNHKQAQPLPPGRYKVAHFSLF